MKNSSVTVFRVCSVVILQVLAEGLELSLKE